MLTESPASPPDAMHLAFYHALNTDERRLYHHAVATALTQVITYQTAPSDALVSAAAYHYQACGEGLSAARYHFMAATVSLSHDRFDQAAQLCLEALATMRSLDESVPVDAQLRVDVVLLLLMSIEGQIRARVQEGESDQIDELIVDAETIAARTGEKRLMAKARLLRAKFVLAVNGLAAAIPHFQAAHDLACGSGDPVIEYLVKADLGFYYVGQDLTGGLAMMEAAHELFDTQIKDSYRGLERPNLERSFYHLKGRIGVVKFDLGRYNEALDWLDASYAQLRNSKLSPVSYYCQPYTAMGLFEKAEAMLKEDLDVARSETEMNAFVIYNLSLLGKLYLEWGRIKEAADYLSQCWTQAKAMDLSWLVTLVGNFHAELLMHEQFSARDLDAAAQEAEMIADLAKTAGWHRSVVTALSLRGQIALAQQDTATALNFSTEAVNYLHSRGALPAVRVEEIYFNHYKVLEAAGQPLTAQDYLRRAYQTLLDKLETLPNDEYRRSMMERVTLNQSILAVAENLLR